jgi:hypothetical protein
MGEGGAGGDGAETEKAELQRLLSRMQAEYPNAPIMKQVRRWADEKLVSDVARKALRATLKAKPADPIAYAQAVVERTLEDERRRGIRNGRKGAEA